MDKEKIIEYIMITPNNFNRTVLESMVGDGMNAEKLEKLIKYCEYTKHNVNRAVLDSLINEGKVDSFLLNEDGEVITDENGADLVIDTVDPMTYRTVLYTDGTLIINERSTNINANIAEHGEATNVYDPLDADHPYAFTFDPDTDMPNIPWWNEIENVTSVEVGSVIQPTSTALWFLGLYDCTSIDLSLLDTSNVTNMNSMFDGCEALTNLDVSLFNTSNVTNMDYMFMECNALTSLDVSSFNTSNVTNMHSMFYHCHALTSLDVSSFNTSNVIDMSNMFWGCNALTSLDISSFNTGNVRSMSRMFSYCGALTTIIASANFVTTNVFDSNGMFNDNVNLVGGSGTVYDSTKTDSTYARIDIAGTPGYFTETTPQPSDLPNPIVK